MTHQLQFAWFGNSGSAHNMLRATGTGRDLLGKVLWHTDAPPHGDVTEIGEFIAGYRVDGVYVVQLTRPDAQASRPGMVSTTAALVDQQDLADVDLAALIDAVTQAADSGTPAELTQADGERADPPGAAALASALLHTKRAAWIGAGFSSAVSAVWRHLAAGDRARLSFGAAHHPAALNIPVADDGLLALTIPERSRPRWSEWTTLTAQAPAPADPALEAWFGRDGGRAAALAAALELPTVRLDQWRHLAAATEPLGRVGELEHEETRSLLQLLGLLQPIAERGREIKERALARLVSVTPTAAYGDIRGLRALPWDALPTPPTRSDLLHPWAQSTLASATRAPDAVTAMAESYRAEDAADAPDSVGAALTAALSDDAAPVAALAEAALASPHGIAALSWMCRRVDVDMLDRAVVSTLHANAPPAWLAELSVGASLPRSHAVSIDVTDPVRAWRDQLGVRRCDEAETLLSERVGEAATVGAALALRDEGLTRRAAGLIAHGRTPLPAGSADDVAYRALWAAAVAAGADPWTAVSPTEAAPVLLDRVARGEPVEEILLTAVAATAGADISDRSDRASIWPRLPDTVRHEFVTATAASLARRLTSALPASEAELGKAMLDAEILGGIAHDDAHQAITVLRLVPDARPEHAGVVARRGRFSTETAVDLGDLIVARRWKSAAETIADLAGVRADLRPAARKAESLFGLLERLRRFAGWSEPARVLATSGELRDALQQVAAQLYPEGPTAQGLWERAGGDDADLPRSDSGRHAWGMAIDAAIKGQRGSPSLRALLEQMTADYPSNRDLQLVAEASEEHYRDD